MPSATTRSVVLGNRAVVERHGDAVAAVVDRVHGRPEREAGVGRGVDQHPLQRIAMDGDHTADTGPPAERELADDRARWLDEAQRLGPEAGAHDGLVEPEGAKRSLTVGIQGDAGAVGAPARAAFDEIDLDPALGQRNRGGETCDSAAGDEHAHRGPLTVVDAAAER